MIQKSHNYHSMSYLDRKQQVVREAYDRIAPKREAWIDRNRYYYESLFAVLRFIVQPRSRVLAIRSDIGQFLNAVSPVYGVGIESSPELIEIAQRKYPHLEFILGDPESFDLRTGEKFDYVLMVNAVGNIIDVEAAFLQLREVIKPESRLVIVYYNFLWEPLIKIAEKLRMKMPQPTQNWLAISDLRNLLALTDFEVIKEYHMLLLPKYIPLVSFLLNKVLARLPFLQRLCFVQAVVARPLIKRENQEGFTVSVVVPCKNEKGNVQDAVERIPTMGKHTEIIFCDDQSTDGTAEEVRKMQNLYPEKDIKIVDGPGICKALNVWRGLDSSKGDISMILDGDLSVAPEELPYFYKAIAEGKGEFINGSRMVYPMQKQAMRTLNIVGNKFFASVFSFILGQHIKDTLCGTKVFWKRDYERMKAFRGTWEVQDHWGDYELLFGAAKLNLKIIELPVHYFERTYGETKMTKRFKNAVVMLKMCLAALKKLKYV